MAKILLVSPSLQQNVQLHLTDNSYGLGLAYLHSAIERAGHTIKTRSYNNTDETIAGDEFAAEFMDFAPDYLLVQLLTMNRVAGYRLIKTAKRLNPGIRIIAGGIHATILYDQLLRNFAIDYVVLGEGEATIVELLASLNSGGTENVSGIAYRENGKTVKTLKRELNNDLDTIPFPKHELFMTPEREMACILTSRGCPFKCSFCCLHTISQRRFRKRSVENVIREIEYIADNFKNTKTIQLADDTFTLDPQRVNDLCAEIIRRKIKMNFTCSARIKPASAEMFKLMKKAGFTGIGFGLETGSEKLLKSIHKNITKDDVMDTFKMLQGVNINIVTYLMVGFPGESNETVNETINLIKQLRKIKYFEFAGVARVWVYPDTELCRIMKDNGKLDDNFWLTDKDVPYFTVEHTEEELYKMVLKIAVSCTTARQWIKRLWDGASHPACAIQSSLLRAARLKKAFFSKKSLNRTGGQSP